MGLALCNVYPDFVKESVAVAVVGMAVTVTLAGLPDEDRQRIARDNASELLGVPVPG